MNRNINLFCLPFAGGNKYSYRQYKSKAPSHLNLIPLEYPGRGARMKEALVSNIEDLVDDLYNQISDIVDKNNYAVYGHSMGGLLAYLLTVKLYENKRKPPLHLFITGTSGPSAPSRLASKRHLLPKNEFIEEIRELDGMPDDILQNEELLDYLEPILRADFRISENYLHESRDRLNLPLTVITGTEEDMEMEDILLWQKETTCVADFRQFPGNHFFIFQHSDEIIEIISNKLSINSKTPIYG